RFSHRPAGSRRETGSAAENDRDASRDSRRGSRCDVSASSRTSPAPSPAPSPPRRTTGRSYTEESRASKDAYPPHSLITSGGPERILLKTEAARFETGGDRVGD